MNWNLREKLEQARAADRTGRGLPEERSPWVVREGVTKTADVIDIPPLRDDGGLPVWTGTPGDANAMADAARTHERTSGMIAPGDPCAFCGQKISTDLVDLVTGETHLSCAGCGARHVVHGRD